MSSFGWKLSRRRFSHRCERKLMKFMMPGCACYAASALKRFSSRDISQVCIQYFQRIYQPMTLYFHNRLNIVMSSARRPISHSCICASRLSLSSERFLHYCGFYMSTFASSFPLLIITKLEFVARKIFARTKSIALRFPKKALNENKVSGRDAPKRQLTWKAANHSNETNNERKFIVNRFFISKRSKSVVN